MSKKILYWDKYENPIKMILLREQSPELILSIIQIIINNKGLFFSITNTHDEITLLVDESLDCIKTFDNKETYIAYILSDTGSLLEESGLIKKISTVFSNYNIPIMYTTTHNNNYLFIPKKYEGQTDKIINDGIIID